MTTGGSESEESERLVVEVVDDQLVEVARAEDPPPTPHTSGGPHALFWLSLGLLVVGGIVAGVDADGEPPAAALGSAWLYRIEVGLLVFALGYLMALLLWLAWFGKTFPRVDVPPGVGVDVPGDGDLNAAAQETTSIASRVKAAVDKQNEINRAILKRLDRIDPPDDTTVDSRGGRVS